MDGISYITLERARQVAEKGYTSAHDDEHKGGEIAAQAVYLATPVRAYKVTPHADGVSWQEIRGRSWENAGRGTPGYVPWSAIELLPRRLPQHYLVSTAADAAVPGWGDDVPSTGRELRERRIRELTQAGALIAAEIDRLLRVDGELES
jgi:hypothetical protein